MLIVEFDLDSPILREALERTPEMTVTTEEVYRISDDEIRYLFWADGGDVEAFESALATDPTVTNLTELTALPSRRLYRVDFTERGIMGASFPVWSELDVVLLESRGTHQGWQLRMRFPNRDRLADYREYCRLNDIRFDLQAVYDEAKRAHESDDRVSDNQRMALATALEAGYFEVPRRASLADVAELLGVSSQATSERLRRGMSTIVEQSVT